MTPSIRLISAGVRVRVKLPALKARGSPDRNKPQFIALLDPALKARGAARALPVNDKDLTPLPPSKYGVSG